MADLTPEQMRRMHDFAEQLAELAEHQEDQWKVQTVVVDPRRDKKAVTVHSDPSQGPDGIRYRKTVPYAFGDTVTAGRWTLDTTSLKSCPADW
ncbi:hypothetical protein ACFZBM_24230 [Streptomyces lavendulae]|uniref:hypothetical protein n=1 Tax=Streptomyces lavendulae TaxID=1914 RepID=UPI0036EDF2A4